MKRGDKILCKVDFFYGGTKAFSEGNLYEVTYVDNAYIRLVSDINGSGIGKHGEIICAKQDVYFARKNANLVNHTVGYIWEYFLTDLETLKRTRIKKLKNLPIW